MIKLHDIMIEFFRKFPKLLTIFSRGQINVEYNNSIPTACALFNDNKLRFEILVNPDFIYKVYEVDGMDGCVLILMHEALHIINGHLFTPELLTNASKANKAMDIAIHEIIHEIKKMNVSSIIWTIEKLHANGINAPQKASYLVYYPLIPDDDSNNNNSDGSNSNNNGGGNSKGNNNSNSGGDSSSGYNNNWNIGDVKYSDSQAAKQICKEIQEHIKRIGNESYLVEKMIKVHNIVRISNKIINFVNINARKSVWYKTHPVVEVPPRRKQIKSDITIYIDQSGSMDDNELSAIGGVIKYLSAKYNIDLHAFDVDVTKLNSALIKSGYLERKFSGGTNIDKLLKDETENKEKIKKFIIFTDGCMDLPESYKKHADNVLFIFTTTKDNQIINKVKHYIMMEGI